MPTFVWSQKSRKMSISPPPSPYVIPIVSGNKQNIKHIFGKEDMQM